MSFWVASPFTTKRQNDLLPIFSHRNDHMKLDDTQKARVAQWIEQGAKLSEIQSRLAAELGITLTYMEARFLVDDLKLVPKDPERPKTPDLPPPPSASLKSQPLSPNSPDASGPAQAQVSVSVDQIARPGTLVSGKVTFSDGQKAEWSLDQMGRLGLAAEQKGYRPSAADVQEFQAELHTQLAKMGF
jgi:hypothetical protein